MEERKDSKKEKKDLKEEYLNLSRKYSLPEYCSLDNDFEIEDIDPESNILREIIKQMHNQIDFYSRLLEGLIQPDSKLSDMKEAENLDREEQAKVTEVYRNLMLLNRTLLLSNLEYTSESTAKEISTAHNEWQKLKKDLKLILSKMKDTWKQENKKDSERKEKHGGYYG